MNIEIKKCPFCGGEPECNFRRGERNPFRSFEPCDEENRYWYIFAQCTQCGAKGAEFKTSDMPWNGEASFKTFDGREALKKWNKRCTDD